MKPVAKLEFVTDDTWSDSAFRKKMHETILDLGEITLNDKAQ